MILHSIAKTKKRRNKNEQENNRRRSGDSHSVDFNRLWQKKTKASSKAVSVATQAVAVADKYLNGVVSYDQIKADLNNIQNKMKYAENGGTGTDEQRADFSISLDILHLSTTILFDSIDKNAKSYDEVLEARNELAEDAGLTTRN